MSVCSARPVLRRVAFSLLFACPWAFAGPGHDHGHDTAEPSVATPASPRVVMVSDQFELVGLLEDHGLNLYLDEFASNAPVTDALVEIELSGKMHVAEAQADGRYELHLDAPLGEGVHPLLVTVLTDTGSDLLIGELDVHGPGTPAGSEHAEYALLEPYLPWLLGLFGMFLLLLLWMIRADHAGRAEREVSA